MEYSAGVFAIQDLFLVFASPMTEAGLRTVGTVASVNRNVPPQLLGTMIQQALSASEQCVPAATEADWPSAYEPLLRATGLPTLKAFMLASALVAIDVDSDKMITVRLVEKPERGNRTMLTADDVFGTACQFAIGTAVIRMFETSRS
jgi:hypothetical protein